MDADTQGVDMVFADTTTGAEGGDMACSLWSLSCSGRALSSTESTVSGRLTIRTDTGMTIIGIRAIDPVTPSVLGNMIGCLISDMVFTPQDSGSKDDDEGDDE